MGRKQGRMPPYEVMRSVGSGTPLPRSRVRNVRGGSVGLLGLVLGAVKTLFSKTASLGGVFRMGQAPKASVAQGGVERKTASGGLRSLADAAAQTVELRLSWGLMGLLSVVFLAMLGLMFQVGQHVAGRPNSANPAAGVASNTAGDTAGSLAAQRQASGNSSARPGEAVRGTETLASSQTPGTRTPGTPGGDSSYAPVGPMNGTPQEAPGGGIAQTDKRAEGRNYFILVTVPASETQGARELQRFLAEGGLETYLDKADNAGLRSLVDVTRGYTRQEMADYAHFEHKRRILALGKLWKNRNRGRGTDLSDSYPDRFGGAVE